MAALAGGTVTQIARISQIFLHCYACRGAGAGFYSPARGAREIYKSRRLFPLGDFFSGCGAGLDLVDFYKVSLASRDELFFCYARGGGMSHR